MNRDEIVAFLNENSAAVVATSTGDKPHLRFIWTVKTDSNGVLFHTGKIKEFHSQLLENPSVEICFFNPDKTVQIRVAGVARVLENEALKRELVEERTFLKDIGKETGSLDFFSLFLLEHCRASVWTFETNMHPKEWIEL